MGNYLLLFTQAFEAESGSDADPVLWGIQDNFAQHSGDQAATDSTKHSKQKKLTEKQRGRVESQILLPEHTSLIPRGDW